MAKVTVDQIRLALSACGGRVARAARVLGLSRNSLYKRLANTGISPDEFRGDMVTGAAVSGDAQATDGALRPRPVGLTTAAAPASVSRSAIYPSKPGAHTFHRVSSATASPAAQEEPKQLRLSRSVYLRPDQIKVIDDACLDLPRVLREKLSPSKVLEKFIDDCFAGWLQSKLEPGEKRPGRKTAAKQE